MKQLIFVALSILFGTLLARAELRTFTNVDGRKVEGELLVVEDGNAVMRLGNDSLAKIPLDSLSADDRAFVTKWWEENKNKLGPMDIRLTIDKNSDRIERTVTRPKGGGAKNQTANQITKKLTIDEFNYTGILNNYTRKNIADITVGYTIYKRSIGRDASGLKNDTKEIKGEKVISLLEASKTATFETEKVRCEDSSESGAKSGGKGSQMIWKRETVLGIVVTLSVDGKEIVKQSDPENLLARLREAEQREDSRE